MRYLWLLVLLLFSCSHPNVSKDYFQYSYLPDLPPNSDYATQTGLAGAYSGMDEEVLILAGGANFPDALPWEGGTKIYHDEIFVFDKSQGEWEIMRHKIPFRSAYGGAISTPKGLLCFGGNTADEIISAAWLINYLPESGSVEITEVPGLSIPLTNFAFSVIDNKLYVAGGESSEPAGSGNYFFSLDLSEPNVADWNWTALPAWEGAPRSFAIGVTQSNGLDNCFYLFAGRNAQPEREPQVLFDAHLYNPTTQTWSVIADGGQPKFPVMAGTAFPLGASTIVFPSGANGQSMQKELRIKRQLAAAENAPAKDSLAQVLRKHLIEHPGFGKQVLAFNTITHETYLIDSLPATAQVTTTAVRWGDEVVIPSGEIRPGVRSPKVLKISIQKNRGHLGLLDMMVIACYFLVLAGMGYFFSKRQKNTNDYFKGGGRIPWWAAGLSIFGTALSAITFMALPSKTFATDWAYFMLNMTIFLVAPIIILVFIPFYRKLNVTTAYEYLEIRFNLAVRLIGSLSFILFQIGRMGIVLYLPAIALQVVTGIDIFVCIGLMGLVSLLYTMFGGIEAVIWTDVMQVVVLLGGALLSLALMIHGIEGGFSTIMDTAIQDDKFNVFDLELSLQQPTLWVMLFGGMFASMTTYGTDQTMVQRYLTTNTRQEANKSVWTNAILTIPASLIFFFVGTALFVFFKTYPTELNPTFVSNDAIFPWYIISQLPTGITGLLIAAIFAASMSSLSSSMNSAATAYVTDIHVRFGWTRNLDPLTIARSATLVIGLIGILFAFLMTTMDVKSLWDEFQKILGLVIGSLGGVFLLGLLVKRANSFGAIIGLSLSIVVQIAMGIYQPVHLLLYASTGVISCFVFGYLASFFGGPRSS